MKANSQKAFVFSSLLHALVLGSLAVAAFLPGCEEEEAPHVFELVSAPAMSNPLPTAESPPADEAPQLQPARIPDLAEMDPLDIPEVQPAPAPAPTPKPTPQPKPKPLPKVSYTDFIEENPREAPRTQPTPRPRPQIERPRISTEELRRDLESIVVPRTGEIQVRQMTAAETDLLAAYRDRLKSLLDAAYRKPSGLYGREFSTRVQFTVSTRGVITGVRIVQSSGNEIFDQSVRDAFARVGNVGAPPGGKAITFQLPFEMSDHYR